MKKSTHFFKRWTSRLSLTLLFFLMGTTFGFSLDDPSHYIDSAQSNFNLGLYSNSAKFYRAWFKTQKEYDHENFSIYLRFASTCDYSGQKKEAQEVYMYLLRETKKQNDPLSELKVQISLADFYRSIQEYDAAREIIEQVTFPPDTNDRLIGILNVVYHRHAAFYNEVGEFKKAIYFSHKSIGMVNRMNDLRFYSIPYNELGNIYEKLNQLDSALYYLSKSLAISKEFNSVDEYSNSLANYTAALIKYDLIDSAINCSLENLKLINSDQLVGRLTSVYRTLKELYEKKGDKLKSLEYAVLEQSEINKNLKRIHSEDISRQQVLFLTERKEEEIKSQAKLLKKTSKNNFLLAVGGGLLALLLVLVVIFYFNVKSRNKQLRALIKENRFLLNESNHRIKNNLQLITSILHQEIRKVDKENKEVLMSVTGKIDAIAVLHKELYLFQDKENIELKGYMDNLFLNMNSFLSESNVKVDMDIEEVETKVDHGVYIGILISELVVNSLKYGFNQIKEKSITLKSYLQNEQLVIEYSDSGTGIADKNETPKLIPMVCYKLKGAFQMGTGKGFNVTLKFPLA